MLKRSVSPEVPQDNEQIIHCGCIEVDLQRKAVSVDGQPIALTRKEFLILALLMQHPGEHFHRQQIIEKVWDDDTYVGDRSVDVNIARLRKKMGRCADCIVNHSGFGYTFIHNS